MTSKLKLQPPQKHVDKSQKQQFIVEFPPELTQSLGSVAFVNIDRKHFLPPVLLTGIAKQQKEEKGKAPVTNPVFQGELSIQVLSREDKEITFEKCERCQEKDSHIFPLFEKIDGPEEKEHHHPRNCFALIGCDKVQFEKGKAIIPVYFRCCPTHHTSKKGENFVRMRVRIVKSPNIVYESDFMQVQWKKGKHNRIQVKGNPSSPSVVPQPCVNSISSIVNANSNRESAFVANPSIHSVTVPPSANTPSNTSSPSLKPTTHQLPPVSTSPSTTLAPVVPTPTKPSPPSNNGNNMLQLPSLLNKEPNTTSTTTTTTTTTTSAPNANPFMLNPLQNNPISNIMNNTGVPPYQAYMNMFQHLQTYYVQPLEEENKKLRQELADITRSLTGLKEENRKLNDTTITTHSARDANFLDQLKYYQYEIDCNPSFLSYDDDEEMLPEEEKEEFETNHIRPYGKRTMREAIKFMKFKSNVKLVLLKHNGTQWFEPLDRRNTSTYLDGERFGIRIINKNSFPVYVRLHKITSSSTSQNIPLSDEDFLRIEGCEQENKWEPTYFDLGTVTLNTETAEPVELMKLLVTTNGNKFGGEKLSVILTKSYVIAKKTM